MDNSFIIAKAQSTVMVHTELESVTPISYTLEQNAHLTYFFMPDPSGENFHITFYLKEKSSLIFFAVLPDSHAHITLNFILEGAYSSVFVRGMYALDFDHAIILRTTQDHKTVHTMSDLSFKGVLTGKAHIDFEGNINIGKDADFSNARQQNKNIVLSPYARAKSKPQLEIETNEVQCAHGSAVGQLDEQQLFYMRSRGIEQIKAKQLLIRSFFADILDELPADMLSTIQKKLDSVCGE